jgi:hypothetical protein
MFIKAGFDCAQCPNSEYCVPEIKRMTEEVKSALEQDNLPVGFIKEKTLQWIEIRKSCALKEGETTQKEITKGFIGGWNRNPIIEWFDCRQCEKSKVCKDKERTEMWLEENKHSVETELVSSSISAPWIDIRIICNRMPSRDKPKIGFGKLE